MGDIHHAPIHLEIVEQFESSHTVLRCKVDSEGAETQLPSTLIVKQRVLDRAIKPDQFDQVVLFRNEWASLDFLAFVSNEDVPGPRRFASDREAGLVIMEDLGSVQTVQDVLYGNDRQAAIKALVGMGRAMGYIQGISFGRESDFTAIQKELSASTAQCYANRDLRLNLNVLRDLITGLDLEYEDRLEQALLQLENEIHGPGTWRTFVHNDAGPHNFAVTGEGVKLLDFEFAGFDYGPVDAACARLGFPPSFRGRILPQEIVSQVEDNYADELIKQAPEMAERLDFSLGLTKACAHWAFSTLNGFAPYLHERLKQGEAYDRRDGRDPKKDAFFRQSVLTILRLTVSSLEDNEQLAELRVPLSRIIEKLLQIWPKPPYLDTYPAFGGEGWHYP